MLLLACVHACMRKPSVMSLPTSLAVGAANLDGREVGEKLLEVSRTDGWPPGVVAAVMEPEEEEEVEMKSRGGGGGAGADEEDGGQSDS